MLVGNDKKETRVHIITLHSIHVLNTSYTRTLYGANEIHYDNFKLSVLILDHQGMYCIVHVCITLYVITS